MIDRGKAVFLSYASQDAEAGSRVCDALRTAGVEVWFDRSELRGGDTWDALIRRQIKACYLFVPIISANTQSREEGYFRREWKLAVDRTNDMAEDRTFILPIVIDGIADSEARVPEKFREVQWTHLPGGSVTQAFAGRVQQLLSATIAARPADAEPASAVRPGAAAALLGSKHPGQSSVLVRVMPIALGLIGLGLAWLLFEHFHVRPTVPSAAPAAATRADALATPGSQGVFAPPEHSLAVLPFTNMSGDAAQEYFSDGLSEELLNALASVQGLQVVARVSSFSFKGKNETVGEIARQLNVGAVLEGSVRRDKAHVRISAELINALTGFQLWSQTYDRQMKDVLTLQSDIATAVSAALKVKLLQSGSKGGEIGGTDNPQAFDVYLRAQRIMRQRLSVETLTKAVAQFDEAIALDPQYANAYLGRGTLRMEYEFNFTADAGEAQRQGELALADVRKAAELAPELGAAHTAIGSKLSGELKFSEAAAQYEMGIRLSPGDARTYDGSARFLAETGRFDEAIAQSRRAIELDPVNPTIFATVAYTYYLARHYAEAIAVSRRALQFGPDNGFATGTMGLAYIALGDNEAARAACDVPQRQWDDALCLALAYHKLGRQAEARATFDRMKQEFGEALSYQETEIYAQWGDVPRALDALERAFRTRDPGVSLVKVDPLLDPLRKEPRFQAIEQKLNIRT